MCGYCGCSTPGETRAHSGHTHTHTHDHPHDHGHGHDHPHHDHDHDHSGDHTHHHHHHGEEEGRVLELSRAILDKNSRLAERARGLFLGTGVTALNLVSSPGSGKTRLLEATAARLGDRFRCAAIVGDCATDNDARRLRAAGFPAIQISTGNVCHLDAHMVLHAVEDLGGLRGIDLLFIENVGNLVCPAAFDLGEDKRVVLMSVTEGEDKPKKYPPIFTGADAVILTKMDLADAVGFDLGAARSNLGDVAPGARRFELSAKSGEGLDEWIQWLGECVEAKRAVKI
jgi:hydrogenase nickel incorporation protein HypB